MPHTLEELTAQALQLPPDDRMALAESLLLTIDESRDPLIDDGIVAEWEGRLRELCEGKITGIPAEQVLREIRDELSRSA